MVIAFTAVWAFFPPAAAYAGMARKSFWYGLAAVLFVRSAYLDFGFFRRVSGRSPARASVELALQRLLCWTAALVIFAVPAGWQVTASALGL